MQDLFLSVCLCLCVPVCLCESLLHAKFRLNDIIAIRGKPTSELQDLTCHMGSYTVAVTGERAPANPSQKGWYLINIPQRDGRLSCPR